MDNVKNDFPIFKAYPNLVYLDSGATSQKPQAVIDAVTDFYITKNANIHRGIYKLAEDATKLYEETRSLVSQFINANKPEEIVFTKNTNEAINIVAYGWGKKFLQKEDIIVLTEMEHHANLVPWLRLKEEIGVELFYIPLNNEYRLDYEKVNTSNVDLSKIKLVALTHVSNVLGTVNPVEEIVAYLKNQGITAKILIDAAQSVPHMPVDVKKLQCDFLAFSGHKMLGPAGVGALWAKEELLNDMQPFLVGSNMIRIVTKEKADWADLPDKFEPGTGNLEGVAGLAAAVKYLQNIGMENIYRHEQSLSQYGLEKLKQIPGFKLYGPSTPENRLAIFSFGLDDAHPHDIAQILDTKDVCVRSGHHCAQVLMKVLGVPATVRASAYLYNTTEDVDKLIEGIEVVKDTLKI